MPVRSAPICKAILDGGAAVEGTAREFLALNKAVGANILEGTVANTPEGEAFVQEAIAFQEKAKVVLGELLDKAKDLCMTQPVA